MAGGLFAGDTGSLEEMLAPLLASRAATRPMEGQAPFPEVPSTALPFGEPGGVGIPNLPPEVNPSPVAPGSVPLPVPVPEAARDLGGGPPTIPGLPPIRTGLPAISSDAFGGAFTGNSSVPPAQGPTPSGATVDAAARATDMSAQAKQREGLADALKGVGAIKPPEVQKISSPNAPRPTGTIKAGDLQALLLALNAGAPAMERKLPMTLGQGIGRG